MERCDLMSHSFHLMMYAQNTQTITYYTGGIFAQILQVIAIVVIIVISVFCPPAGAGMFAGLAGAIGVTSALGIAIVNLVAGYLIGMALSIALKIIAKEVGGVFGAVLSVALIVAVTYLTGGFDSTGSTFLTVAKYAETLTSIASQVVSLSVGESMEKLQKSYNQLLDERDHFNELYKTRAEELEEAYNDLYNPIDARFLSYLNRLPEGGNQVQSSKIISPSSFFYASIQSQYNYDYLYHNDVSTFTNEQLTSGII